MSHDMTAGMIINQENMNMGRMVLMEFICRVGPSGYVHSY